MKLILKTVAIIFVFTALCLSMKAADERFRVGGSVELSPSDGIQRIYFDRYNLMWICTDTGLKQYDGYSLKTYQSGVVRPQIFPNNYIMSVTADNDDHIWIGTRNGVVRMDRRNDKYKTYQLGSDAQKVIYVLFTSKDGTVWMGSAGGLSVYDKKNDSFVTYDASNSFFVSPDGKRRPSAYYDVKSIAESSDGKYLYIGTWNSGLLRLRRGTNTFHQLPDVNGEGNSYTLCTDSRGRLWVGTWRKGVVCIENPTDFTNPRIITYYCGSQNEFNSIYCIMEHESTGTIWACSRYGTYILDTNNLANGFVKYETETDGGFFGDNIYVEQDKTGNIWLQNRFGKIRQILMGESLFECIVSNRSNDRFAKKIITSVYTADGKIIYASLLPYGLMRHNRLTGETLYDNDIPEFRNIPQQQINCAVTSITRRKNGNLLLASEVFGLIEVTPDGQCQIYTKKNSPILADEHINTLAETRDGRILIGTRTGIGVWNVERGVRNAAGPQHVAPLDGKVMDIIVDGKKLDRCDVRHIREAADGSLWISTENEGVIKISGNTATQYAPCNGKMPVADITACHDDKRGWTWAISASGGLFRYDKKRDVFRHVMFYHYITDKKAYFINEDKRGDLWIAFDNRLTRMSFKKGDSRPQIMVYTKEDVMGNSMIFMPNCTVTHGDELYFGVANSIMSFNTQKDDAGRYRRGYSLTVTDIRIDDKPYLRIDGELRKRIFENTPEYTRRLNIPSSVSKVSIEFALTAFNAPGENRYAYKLDGYNSEWQYRDAATRNATFENLPSGTYRLHIKASDSKNGWTDLPYTITIKVLPPWWATWWAYLIYIIIGIGCIYFAVYTYKERLKTQNKLQMQVVFTNLTHELLTPLAVISSSVDTLRYEAPQCEESYTIIKSSIDRLTRLLRNILEVRKSQAGRMRLLVAQDNMSRILTNDLRNIMPVVQKKNIRLTEDIEEVTGWFDKDKVDTMIYNLLSNALKYTPEGRSIHVGLHTDCNNNAVLTVSDKGIGIAPEKMKYLYHRFLDGDYRKMNISGTGIGLSLVHTLVKLHHGDIDCESKEGEGTTFTITLPLDKAAYSNKECSVLSDVVPQQVEPTLPQDMILPKKTVTTGCGPTDRCYSVLLVEDNIELLTIMANELSRYYNVFTAHDGSQALKKIAKKELDVVITDVMMPIMDGIDLVRQIKGNEDTAQLPVIILTAKTGNENRNEAYRTGADEYITKPFHIEDLLLRISNIIENRERIKRKFSRQTDIVKPQSHGSSPDDLFLQKAIDMVKRHIKDSNYGREEFAADMCVSPSTLYNKLRALTGQNISGFINSIRMKVAYSMLEKNPHISVNELSTAVGFNTSNYFSRLFKQEFGMLPSEFCEKKK